MKLHLLHRFIRKISEIKIFSLLGVKQKQSKYKNLVEKERIVRKWKKKSVDSIKVVDAVDWY